MPRMPSRQNHTALRPWCLFPNFNPPLSNSNSPPRVCYFSRVFLLSNGLMDFDDGGSRLVLLQISVNIDHREPSLLCICGGLTG